MKLKLTREQVLSVTKEGLLLLQKINAALKPKPGQEEKLNSDFEAIKQTRRFLDTVV